MWQGAFSIGTPSKEKGVNNKKTFRSLRQRKCSMSVLIRTSISEAGEEE